MLGFNKICSFTVFPDSPAEEAGLQQGDVILEYNGHKVKSLGSFRNNVALMHPGSKLNLVIDRDGLLEDREDSMATVVTHDGIHVDLWDLVVAKNCSADSLELKKIQQGQSLRERKVFP